jgi:hypothetical protein
MQEPKPKKRGPRLRSDERKRTVEVLKRLIHGGRPRKGDPRIQGSALANLFEPEPGPRKGGGVKDHDRADALKLHLRGKVQPSPETTWAYGEYLRRLGVPWCSGLWMLWATGRHADVVGTLVMWLRDRPDTSREMVDDVWHALALGTRLASPTGLDQDLEFLRRHVRNARLTTETYEALWSWARDRVRRAEWTVIARSYHVYLEREIAKIPWLALAPLADEMQVAFNRWLTVGRNVPHALPLDRLAQATLAVANSRLSLVDRETAVLVMLAQWLTGIEYQTQAPLYIRPVDPVYDAPYQSEFGPVPAPLPALDLPGIAGID